MSKTQPKVSETALAVGGLIAAAALLTAVYYKIASKFNSIMP